MPDRMGYRAKWVPERNTVCETEMHRAVPEGLTINTARVGRDTPAAWSNDAEFRAMSQATLDGRPGALARLAAAEVDHYIVGHGGAGLSGGARNAGRQQDAVITPRLPDSGVVSGGLWEACGYAVAGAYGLNRGSAFEIADTSEDALRSGMNEMAATEAEAMRRSDRRALVQSR